MECDPPPIYLPKNNNHQYPTLSLTNEKIM